MIGALKCREETTGTLHPRFLLGLICTTAKREQLHQWFRGLETSECPFANLPEARAGRWGEG
jgi:hypothetical protein